MQQSIQQILVFVSCPGDVEEEKKIVSDTCDELTDGVYKSRNIQIKVIEWKNDVVPLLTGEGAQTQINRQIGERDYDVYVGIMWKRFGEKQANGLTPTEEEFENAFKRYEDTGRPIIQFYFKLDAFYPNSTKETQQVLEVQRFKERIKSLDLGLYAVFTGKEEFKSQLVKNLPQIADKINSLTSPKTPISKKHYSEVAHYIPRKVCSTREYFSAGKLFLMTELAQDTTSIIEQHKRVVILGDAGVGKTTELQRIAWYFSQNDDSLYPFFVPLNKYVNQKIEDLLPPTWKEIPESQLLVILDGLDEIESKNLNDAIRQIELFCEQHQNINIVVSCRTNFYRTEIGRSSGTLKDFSSFVLLNLDERDVKSYINESLGK